MSFLQGFEPQKIFEQGMFSIDDNATPEMLARKRQQIRALMSGAAPRYAGEGLAKLATGVVGGIQGHKMNTHEGEKTSEATALFNTLFGINPQPTPQAAPAAPMAAAPAAPATPAAPQQAMDPLAQALINGNPELGQPTTPPPASDIVTAADALTPAPVTSGPIPSGDDVLQGGEGQDDLLITGPFRFDPNTMGDPEDYIRTGPNVVDPNIDLSGAVIPLEGSPQPSGMSDAASSIYQGLIARGMAPHVAQGFVMNFQDESGLNPSIIEAEPNVHGTRGRGLYQLTGSRRDAYEARYGNDYSVDNQLDWLMHELSSTESRAADRINATTTPGEAGAAIVTNFLRPAEEHRRERSARYLNGGGVLSGGDGQDFATGGQGGDMLSSFAPRGYSGPTQPSGPDLAALAQMASNPWLNSQQQDFLGSVMGQQGQERARIAQAQMQANDPLRQLQIQQAELNLRQDMAGNATQATVQSSVPLDDGTTVMVMNDGTRRVLSPTGEELQGQAAADAILAAREYTVQNQQDIYRARGEGDLQADINLGGQAAAVEDIAEASVAAGMEAWESYGKLQTSLSNIDNAIAALDNGAQSGIVYNMLPDVTEASASLRNSMNRMGLDVVGAVTFGALSEAELKMAMETAVPQGLGPEALRSWLVERRTAQQKAAAMAADAAQFLTVPGNTINDWIERNRGQQPTQATPATTQSAVPDLFMTHPLVAERAAENGLTVEEYWETRTEEQRAAWAN